MSRGTAGEYWAATAEGHFETMSSPFRPGERAGADTPAFAPKRVRRELPPLTASQSIVDAIAACAPSQKAETPTGRATDDVPATAAEQVSLV